MYNPSDPSLIALTPVVMVCELGREAMDIDHSFLEQYVQALRECVQQVSNNCFVLLNQLHFYAKRVALVCPLAITSLHLDPAPLSKRLHVFTHPRPFTGSLRSAHRGCRSSIRKEGTVWGVHQRPP